MRSLPLGISDFQKIITGNYFYIDKTLLIDELWRATGEVILIPRPRRFGKTLNISMLRYFFEKSSTDTSYLFKNTKIWTLENYRTLQGSLPVIFLSFKDIKEETYGAAYDKFVYTIAEEFKRHRSIIFSKTVPEEEAAEYKAVMNKNASLAEISNSLKFLSHMLRNHYDSEVMILIDEYDSPLHSAYAHGYYKEMVNFLRSLLSAVLKDNTALKRGILTGILRTAKEGIFSGLNNLNVCSLLSDNFQDKFGFTLEEVDYLLEEAHLNKELDAIKSWYNSYRCGNTSLYNPWSLLKCVDEKGALRPYWANTSDNVLIKKIIATADSKVKEELEALLQGTPVTKEIFESFSFPEIDRNSSIVWSLLLFSGYITFTKHELIDGKDMCDLAIPNKEINVLYTHLIQLIFKESLREHHINDLIEALITGNLDVVNTLLQEFIMYSMSFYDIPDTEPERSYHLFILGLLVMLKESYDITSNRESGYGRYDIMLIPKDSSNPGIVIEFKKAEGISQDQLSEAADAALNQIRTKRYAEILHKKGISKVFCYGIAVKGKALLAKISS